MATHKLNGNIKTHRCPSCDTPITSATGVEGDEKPNEGDISICFSCGEILTFNKDLTHDKITEEKLVEIKDSEPEQHKMIMELSNFFKTNKMS